MFRRSRDYMKWDEFAAKLYQREHLLFVSNTARKSIQNMALKGVIA
ncbi:MAG: hypothetical protein ABIB71_00525 [Candidatus Woesearchaeota archaeon]